MNFDKFTYLAFLSPLILFFQQSRSFLLSVFRLVWKKREIDFYPTQFYKILYENSYLIPLDNYKLWETYLGIKKENIYRGVLTKEYNFQIFLYKNTFPIFVYGKNGAFSICYLAFTFPFEKLLSRVYFESVENFCFFTSFSFHSIYGNSYRLQPNAQQIPFPNSEPTKNPAEFKYIIHTHSLVANKWTKLIGYKYDDVSLRLEGNQNDKYIFTKTGGEILKEVTNWLNAKEWYEKRNIDWKRGILLHGSPGSGKSSVILEVCKKLQLPLYKVDLSSLDNKEFEEKINIGGICVILFEDFDTVFDKRENVTKTQNFGGLTFDCFINKLSGVNNLKQCFIFITTNNLEKIDPAVYRPGRIDRVIEFPSMDLDEKKELANKILFDKPELIDNIVNDGKTDTTAEFENRCIKTALDIFWK